ncbi:uncharacterized protein LOC113772494 [Coffea eugenioides]|uniref:C2 domain-containing protein n=1 Tax=Coffea arabica TaxID=13443 RepID=A0A6P6S522_COFAR|nr:uncharacterized protein LOC113772494 [Coffea eugenioides]XP_027172903.1 uncharacterized protein LOC113772494 [Coffea eugenioides]XP_027172904.1 uncharacterized protein LOC113772494 [Coffea eugenioides]
MDSPQSVVSPFKSSAVFAEPEKQTADLFVKSPDHLSRGIGAHRKEAEVYNLEESVGTLEVYIYQARDIHNICIYHKQDVYAKLCLTSDPENAVSTKIINGGGQNPVFNENLRLGVRTVDTSLKCEIWMLSRVRNYLEDQLLGFALVPLSDVLVKSGKLEKEFSLSSTDLFHSPAGFVQLSLSYSGALPDVLAISSAPPSVVTDVAVHDSKAAESVPDELDKIEFPDPKILNENHLMVSEYFGIPCANLDSQSSDSFVSSDTENQLSSEAGVQFVESLSMGTVGSTQFPKLDSPPSSGSTYGSPTASLPVSSQSSETPVVSKSAATEYALPPKENVKERSADAGDAESKASENLPGDSFVKPVVTVKIEPEQKMVQQDIVDMYMKSMQQFTESLAKMKLPMDFESGPTSSGNSSSDQKLESSKNSGNRVFYGSRAFF